MSDKKELTICDNCGTSFLKSAKEKRRRLKKDRSARFFCSRDCALAGKRHGGTRYPPRWDWCENCGQEFLSVRHNRKQGYSRFCSRRCAADASNKSWYAKKIVEDY